MAAFIFAIKRNPYMLGKIRDLFTLNSIHRFFIIIALPAAFAYVFTVFPLQSNDEWGHFLRSIDLTYGNLTDVESINSSLDVPKIQAPESIIPFITNKSLSVDAFENSKDFTSIKDLKDLAWSGKTVRLTDPFAVYPPLSYSFSTIGTLIGKFSDATYAKTLYLGRLTNCIFSLLSFYLAIMIASRGKLYLFLLLGIPSSLSLVSSYSQDAFLMSVTALTIAMITRIHSENDKLFIRLASVGLMIIVLIRPHYFPLLIFFAFFLYSRYLSLKCIAFILFFGLIPSITWYIYVSPIMIKKMFPGVDEGIQLDYVLHNPLDFISMFFESFKELWRKFFIPYISVNKNLYNFWQPVIAFMMLVIFFLSLKNVKDRKDLFLIILLFFCSLMSMVLIELTAYISWTPVKESFIAGLQGRYFLPILMFMALIPVNSKEHEIFGSKLFIPTFFSVITIVFLTNISSLIFVATCFVYR
ncbi:hypothetical protein NL54_15510 [Pantoea stewartii]|uniref:DUF2142 domain-containing protein n=1 Tax=Pantoea stewartii TaxID=66269 RepID=UPI00054311CE|nr:DUF2142 domain-containing protein [Pantoea stewartii]KHE00484.1 hypothetical protein NL54_15510 [Pantoea stewartii]KHN65524.1 hypothetical protein OI73_00830 [Pantoea stewartii]